MKSDDMLTEAMIRALMDDGPNPNAPWLAAVPAEWHEDALFWTAPEVSRAFVVDQIAVALRGVEDDPYVVDRIIGRVIAMALQRSWFEEQARRMKAAMEA